MRKQIVLIAMILLGTVNCGGDKSEPYPAFPYNSSGPSYSVTITNPTTASTYSTYTDSVYLSGTRSASVSSVSWENTSSNTSGQGGVYTYTTWCFFFGYYECTKSVWAAEVPLILGENVINIYGDDTWANSITVTRKPSFDLSGTVSFNTVGQLNIKLALKNTNDPSSVRYAYTDVNGAYRFKFVPQGTYTLTPSDPCFTFIPENLTIVGTDTEIANADFVLASRPGATISGRLLLGNTGEGLYGRVYLQDTRLTSRTGPAFALSAGYYTFTCVPDSSYTITPEHDYYDFTPLSRSVTVTGGTDVTGQDFTGW